MEPEKLMENYYFTFGANHRTHKGDDLISLRDYWVRVIAESYGKAREIFVEHFSTPCMERGAMCWSFQYGEKSFSPEYFPKGEYRLLKQNDYQ